MSSPNDSGMLSRTSSNEFISVQPDVYEDFDEENVEMNGKKSASSSLQPDESFRNILRRKTTNVKNKFEQFKLKKQNNDNSGVLSDTNSDHKGSEIRTKRVFKMKIYLICGTEIWDRNTNKSSTTSYVRLKQSGKTVTKSKIVHHNINPVWCQLVELKLYDLDSKLEVIVYDSEHFKGVEIAQGSLNLKDFEIGVTQEATIQLNQIVNSKVSETIRNGTVLIKFIIKPLESRNDDRGPDQQSIVSPHYDEKTTTILQAGKSTLNKRFSYTLKDKNFSKKEEDAICLSEKLDWNLDFWGLASFYSMGDNYSYANGYVVVTIVSASNVYLEAHKKGASGLWNPEQNTASYSSKNDLPNPFIKAQIGSVKKNTRTLSNTRNPVWNSTFDLKVSHDTDPMIHFSLWHDSGNEHVSLGIGSIDVSKLPFDLTKKFQIPLKNMTKFKTHLTVLVTLTALSDCVSMKANKRITSDSEESSANFTDYDLKSQEFKDVELECVQRVTSYYKLSKSLESIYDVGWFNIQILSSQNIPNGEYYCSVQLPNVIARTRAYKNQTTIDWNKSFVLPIKDIHSLVTISIIEDKDDPEVLGRISIPLLKFQNGKTVGYRFVENGKSTIKFKANIHYNPIKAILVTFKPKEDDYLDEEKYFKINQVEQYFHRIKKNANRVLHFYENINEAKRFVDYITSWERPLQTFLAMIIYQAFVWFGELYMIPFFWLVFIWFNPVVKIIAKIFEPDPSESIYIESDQDNLKEENKKRSFNEIYKSLQRNTFRLEDFLHKVASFCERITMMFSWEVPWLTNLFSVILLIGTFVLYLFPFRWIASAYGFKKFLKRIFKKRSGRPGSVTNFISRYPCIIDLEKQRKFDFTNS